MNRLTTLHPDPDKQGTRIDAAVYEATKSAILRSLEQAGDTGVAFGDLSSEVERRSDPRNGQTVARSLIRRSGSPQRLFLP